MLYQRSNSKIWHIRLRVNGINIRQSAKTTKRAEAAQLEEALRRRAWEQSELGVDRKTWRDGLALWAQHKGTKRAIKRDLGILELAGAKFGESLLEDIGEESVAEHGREIAERTSKGNASRHLAMLRSFFNLMHQQRYMSRSLSIKLYRPESFEPMVLSEDQFRSFLEALPAPVRAVAEFARETGLRRANVFGLHWTQAQPGARWRPYVENGVAYIPGSKAKAGKPITVPLSDRARAILETLPRDSELVFGSVTNFRKLWDRGATKCGFTGLRFHDLRHLWCSSHIKRGTPEHIVQKLGGWSSNSMVKRYTTLAVDDLRKYV